MVSALLGVGGGIVKVPTMHLVMGVPLRVATATSNLMIGITATAGAVIYLLRGELDPFVAGPVAFGVFLGATLGSRTAHRIDVRYLRWLFVVVLAYTALQMARRALGHRLSRPGLAYRWLAHDRPDPPRARGSRACSSAGTYAGVALLAVGIVLMAIGPASTRWPPRPRLRPRQRSSRTSLALRAGGLPVGRPARRDGAAGDPGGRSPRPGSRVGRAPDGGHRASSVLAVLAISVLVVQAEGA